MSSDSWSDRLLGGFRKTSERLAGNLAGFGGSTRLTETQLDDLEDALIMSDLGPRAAARIRARLASARFEEGLDDTTLRQAVADEIAAILRPVAKPLDIVAFPARR
jgi:fused signal recognition particle receptor